MSWFKPKTLSKSHGKPLTKRAKAPASTRPAVARGPVTFTVPMTVQMRIAEFLAKHGRFVFTERQMNMQILGSTPSPDGGTDYAVRTLVNSSGKDHIFNSHVRIYASEHMRLIR